MGLLRMACIVPRWYIYGCSLQQLIDDWSKLDIEQMNFVKDLWQKFYFCSHLQGKETVRIVYDIINCCNDPDMIQMVWGPRPRFFCGGPCSQSKPNEKLQSFYSIFNCFFQPELLIFSHFIYQIVVELCASSRISTSNSDLSSIYIWLAIGIQCMVTI